MRKTIGDLPLACFCEGNEDGVVSVGERLNLQTEDKFVRNSEYILTEKRDCLFG